MEVGLIKYWKQLYWPSNDECMISGSTEMNVVMVNLNDMQMSFYVLMFGKELSTHDLRTWGKGVDQKL